MSDAPELKGPYLGRPLRGQVRRKHYVPHADLVTAANVALHLETPLLLTGEPGCGKTDFAWAAATALATALKEPEAERVEPLECYVRSESRARDLLYHYDALGRFGDAQHGDKERARSVHPYLRLEPLGTALLSSRQRVVLVDEIDKAPRDLPNDLLRELDQGQFEIPEIPPGAAAGEALSGELAGVRLSRHMRRPSGQRMPLVIITSNAERQLPDPFLRRCVFYHIPFPKPKEMGAIAAAYFEDQPPPKELLEPALTVFYALRERGQLVKKPATVEFLGWVSALGLLLKRGAVRADCLGGMVTALGREGALSGLPWEAVPALGCLVKLREDRDALVAAAR